MRPDQEAIQKLDPATAKNILKAECPTCNEDTVNLACPNDYFVQGKPTENTLAYPYHNLAMICYSDYIEVMGRETDCISSKNGQQKLPRLQLKPKGWRDLCNATFAVINYHREQIGIGRWGYYEQKAEPEK